MRPLRVLQVLFLPPFWFHYVSSVTPSVGLNIWTSSLAEDALHYAIRAGGAPRSDREGFWGALLAPLLRSHSIAMWRVVHEAQQASAGVMEHVRAHTALASATTSHDERRPSGSPCTRGCHRQA